MFSLAVPVAAAGIAEASAYTDDEAYIYPIQPGSSEWAAFQSTQEKLNFCQIRGRKFATMPADALLETVLNYPLIHDFLAFNT